MEFGNSEPVIRIRDARGHGHGETKGKEFKNRKLKAGSGNGEIKSMRSHIDIKKSVKWTKREQNMKDKSRVQILLSLYEIISIL